ncbi:MAG: hypothetical protein VKN13_03210 [Cyanobacteriota bacterium]|nr:hypothetical protein [Cyanobacteriota bacterium]
MPEPLVDAQPPALPRDQLRLISLGWALQAAMVAGAVVVVPHALHPPLASGLDSALRAGGCGFFYGLLAFHLQRVDPDDGHLQAGLVGAVCAIRSLAAPAPWGAGEVAGPLEVMMAGLRTWLPLWLPLVAAALWLRGVQRLLPAPRP